MTAAPPQPQQSPEAAPRVADSSGNGNSRYISNATSSEGRYGSALEFTGEGWITIRATRALDATGEITLQAWISSAERQTEWRDVITRENSNGQGAVSLPTVTPNAPGDGWVVKEKVKLVSGKWTHLATTFDGRVQRLYVNGTLVAVRPQIRKKIAEAGTLHVGGNSIWGDRFKGKIDEVWVYNRAPTAEEIRADMNRPVVTGMR